jgi:hypothetical protein
VLFVKVNVGDRVLGVIELSGSLPAPFSIRINIFDMADLMAELVNVSNVFHELDWELPFVSGCLSLAHPQRSDSSGLA